MLPSKLRPTISPFALMTGDPELPPMMSLVRSEERRVRSDWSSDVCSSDLVDEIAPQGFDVAAEDQAYDFTLRIDDRRSRIAADDVVGGDEIERRGQVEFIAAFLVAGGQVERSLIVEAGGAVV